MDLVFELPAKGLPRHRRGQAEEDAAVELQRTRAKIVHRTEQLRPDAMILLTYPRKWLTSPGSPYAWKPGSMTQPVAMRVSQA
jgi:hypothetical protein